MQSVTNDISVRLRAMEPDDLDLLYSVENDSEQWAIGNTSMPYSREFLRDYILSTTGDIFTDKQVRLIIEKEAKPVGIIDLSSFDPKNCRAEVGITVLPQYRNHGIGSEALLLLEQYAIHTIHLHMLYAIVPEDNIASTKLFERNGFALTCNLTDWLYDGSKYRNAMLLQKII